MNNAQYFYRTVIFTRKDNKVSLVDIHQPENVSPLDEWMGIVISLADGHHTIKELFDYMTSRYRQAPANLEETLHSVLERLKDGDLVKLSDHGVELPYYLASPVEELDIEKAKMLMKGDGYVQH